jgi:hypothetical protein
MDEVYALCLKKMASVLKGCVKNRTGFSKKILRLLVDFSQNSFTGQNHACHGSRQLKQLNDLGDRFVFTQ